MIDVVVFDSMSGTFEPLTRFPAAGPVQCLALDSSKNMLYAALATTPPSVDSLRVDRHGALQRSAQGILPAAMAFLSVDPDGRHLLGASYDGDVVATIRLNADGTATEAPSCTRSPGRHAHAVLASPDGRFAYATSLGDDLIVWWALGEKGQLTSEEYIRCPPTSGPRHIRFSPSGEMLYVLHELTGMVISYSRHFGTGRLTETARVSTTPAGLGLAQGSVRNSAGPAPAHNAIWSAELQVSPNGRFLYTTERSSSTIAVLEWDEKRLSLTLCATVDTEKQPRGMVLDPTGEFLFVAGEISNRVSVYRVNKEDGLPEWHMSFACSRGPRWMDFFPLPA